MFLDYFEGSSSCFSCRFCISGCSSPPIACWGSAAPQRCILQRAGAAEGSVPPHREDRGVHGGSGSGRELTSHEQRNVHATQLRQTWVRVRSWAMSGIRCYSSCIPQIWRSITWRTRRWRWWMESRGLCTRRSPTPARSACWRSEMAIRHSLIR